MNPCIELSAGILLERNDAQTLNLVLTHFAPPVMWTTVPLSSVSTMHLLPLQSHLVLIGYHTDSISQACVPVTFM